jgi:tetratricopeptide (TPR) repeat protein
MPVSGQTRAPLPDTMPLAERDFYLELRRLTGIAGFSLRELQDLTFSARSSSGGPAFYSKSQWARWINGRSQPPLKAVARLAAILSAEGIDARQLVGLWERAFTPERVDRSETSQVTLPRELPAGIAHFTGRAAELDALTSVLDAADGGAAGTVVISAIGGMGGVGKTTLALHWAHRVAGRFGDGQLYMNLRGFDPGDAPVAPAEAIRAFLDALGVPPGTIPRTPEGQAGLYRSLMTDRKMLVVLDNARDEEQVRPLLPASPGSLVLVTSRGQLAGLAAADSAHLFDLDVLARSDALELLASRIGRARAAAEPEAIGEIAHLCAYLPLALAVAGARAAARPRLPLASLADELRNTAGRLDALDAGDPASCVRAVFSWSYRQLSPEAARMFRLLGLHPGPDITAAAAASLAATTEPRARRLLSELTRAHLTAEHLPGRYAFHDLLRVYAADQSGATDTDTDRGEATVRVLDHYLHTAHAAAVVINSSIDPIPLAAPGPGVTAEHLPGQQQALAWMAAEHQVLLAAITLADSTGSDVHAWKIPWAISDFLHRRGYWNEQAAIQAAALAAATRLGDIAGQARSRLSLAQVCSLLADHEQALAHCQTCLTLYRQLDDRLGEALVHQYMGVAASLQGHYAEALSHDEQALHLYQSVGHRTGEARMLNNIGYSHGELGDYEQSRAFCQRALTLMTELGHRGDEAAAWDTLGCAEHNLGHLDRAADCYQRSLTLFREFGSRYFEATVLTHLGDTRQAAGQLPQARGAWQEALGILNDLRHSDADQVRAKLAGAHQAAVTDPLPATDASP